MTRIACWVGNVLQVIGVVIAAPGLFVGGILMELGDRCHTWGVWREVAPRIQVSADEQKGTP